MTPALIVAHDALLGFVRQKLFLSLVVGTLGLATAFAYFISWEEKSFENMNDVSHEELTTGSASNGRSKAEKEQFQQGLEQMYSGQQAMFFGASALGGNVVALILFGTLIAAPLRRGELRGVLVRPLERSQYLVGRFLAGAIALLVYWALMSIVFFAFTRHQRTPLPPTVGFAAMLYLCKSVMLGAIALSLSLFLRPPLAMVIAFLGSSDWVSSKGVLYYLLPGDDRLGMAMQLLHGTVTTQRDLALAAAYAIDITLVALGIALLRFRRIDIL